MIGHTGGRNTVSLLCGFSGASSNFFTGRRTLCTQSRSRKCFFSLVSMENDLSQELHGKSCSPLWFRWCTLRFEDWENDFPQIVQPKGFSPEWVRMWVISWLGVWKVLSQTWHIWCMAVSRLGATKGSQSKWDNVYKLISIKKLQLSDLDSQNVFL